MARLSIRCVSVFVHFCNFIPVRHLNLIVVRDCSFGSRIDHRRVIWLFFVLIVDWRRVAFEIRDQRGGSELLTTFGLMLQQTK